MGNFARSLGRAITRAITPPGLGAAAAAAGGANEAALAQERDRQEAMAARQREQQQIQLSKQQEQLQQEGAEREDQVGRARRVPRGRRLLLAATGEGGLASKLGG